MKTCTKCGISKSTAEFSKDVQKRDGLRSHCKICHRAINSAYRMANISRERARIAQWKRENPAKVRAEVSRYRTKNQEKIMAYSVKYRAMNRDKINENAREYRKVNPDKSRAATKKYRTVHIDTVRLADRIYAHTRRARKRDVGGELSSDISERLYKLQRGKCACCKQPLGDDYHLDHIMPLALGGTNTDDNMQLLKARCNLQKHAKHPIDFMKLRGFLC